MTYYIPLFVVILGNTMYQLCAKSVPQTADPYLSLAIAYTVAAILALILFFILSNESGLSAEFHKLNWTAYAIGAAVLTIECGTLFMYRVGWPVNSAAIVASSCVAIILLFLGYLLFHEALDWTKICGVGACIVGVILLNLQH